MKKVAYMRGKSWDQRDKSILWHPFTQEKTADPVVVIERGEGSFVWDTQGKRYIDALSSWWTILHGHGCLAIAHALEKQFRELDHLIFAGFSHKPAISLCEALRPYMPPPLTRFFFSDNGSTSVEVALKIAFQYWKNKDVKTRKHFLSFSGGYHGDTLGAMGVGATSGFFDAFAEMGPRAHGLEFAQTWWGDKDCIAREQEALTQTRLYLERYGEQVSACIMEPLVQGASGMRICRPEFMRAMVDMLREFDILIIFDEVMTGFCRTGTFFAWEHIERFPDIMCLSKGLTGGVMPLALTVVSEHIFEAFLSDDPQKAFIHGHSYTANPLACAAALASLERLESGQSQKCRKDLFEAQRIGLHKLCAHIPQLSHPRTLGAIAAVTLPEGISSQVKRLAMERGLIVRPLGRELYILPPYETPYETVEDIYAILHECLKTIL